MLALAASLVVTMASVALPVEAEAGILLQTSSGVWVNGNQFAYSAQTMPGIVLMPEVRGNSGFMAQRALAWNQYRRADSSTGFMLVDPAGNGQVTASSPRQANVRAHVGRATAYRLEYFKK